MLAGGVRKTGSDTGAIDCGLGAAREHRARGTHRNGHLARLKVQAQTRGSIVSRARADHGGRTAGSAPLRPEGSGGLMCGEHPR